MYQPPLPILQYHRFVVPITHFLPMHASMVYCLPRIMSFLSRDSQRRAILTGYRYYDEFYFAVFNVIMTMMKNSAFFYLSSQASPT